MLIKPSLFFQSFNIWFQSLLRELANNIISVFFIGFIYLALWCFPQTIDLLLILNQADTFLLEVPLYFTLLTAASFLIWNVPKYFYYHNHKDISFSNHIGFIPNQHYAFQNTNEFASYSYRTRIHMRKTVPRILAILLLSISALSILNAMESFGLENTYTDFLNPMNTLILIIFFLLLLSEPKLYTFLKTFFNRSSKVTLVFFGISIGLIFLIISLGTLNTQAEKDLGNLFISNSALALLFSILSFNSYSFLKKIPKRKFYGAILISGYILLVVFLIFNFFPDLASHINPLSIIILSLSSLFMICFILILLGKKLKLPLLAIVVVLSVFFTRFFSDTSEHYELNIQKTTVVRPSLDTYIYQWLKSREDIIVRSDSAFPIILVSAEGGGSRAGLWSFLVHSYLYEKSNGAYFEKNLLSLTGASGGGVGNAMFFAEAQNANINNTKSDFKNSVDTAYPDLAYKASAIYKENYLSVAILSLLGRDMFKEITGLFDFKDRGQLLEEQWIQEHKKYFYNSRKESVINKEFLSFYKNILNTNHKIPPLLFINTTHTQTGNYNIISPVRYKHLRPLEGMDDFLDNLPYDYPSNSIKLSTAMRINASFPFITSVGGVKKNNSLSDQYADAGYYDNVGGRISLGIEEVLKKVLNDSFPKLKEKVKIKQIVIVNEEDHKKIKTSTQILAPLTTLRNVRNGHTQEVLKKLGNDYVIKLKRTEINLSAQNLLNNKIDKEELTVKPVLPLGRYLSTIAIRSMEARLDSISKELDIILK